MSVNATSGANDIEIGEYEHGVDPEDQSDSLRYCKECDGRRYSRLPSGLCYNCNRAARLAATDEEKE